MRTTAARLLGTSRRTASVETYGDGTMPCDHGTGADGCGSGNDAAKAIELCAQTTTTNRKYGVISAAYVRADGPRSRPPGCRSASRPGSEPTYRCRRGANMLAMSTGHARTVSQWERMQWDLVRDQRLTATPSDGLSRGRPRVPTDHRDRRRRRARAAGPGTDERDGLLLS